MPRWPLFLPPHVAAAFLALTLPVHADNAASPVGEPVLEEPTRHCLGVYWFVGGDANGNARVDVQYRQKGQDQWRSAMPLFRVEKGAWKGESGKPAVCAPQGAALLAGSILGLEPDTEYVLRLVLSDPDGGAVERLLSARTLAEPADPPGLAYYHVVPGSGGGSGTQADPFRGLMAAQAAAQPGNVFWLHAGVYGGTWEVLHSGEPGLPIIWRAAGDGEAVIDGQGAGQAWPGRAISASDIHDVWFEGLTIRNAQWGLVAHEAARIVIRRCRFYNVHNGITATRNTRDAVRGHFICDNVLEGPYQWPRPEQGEIEEWRGIQITGAGHVICYNRVAGFKDAIDTFPSARCEAIDIHNNEISDCLDDGIEMDYSFRNTRCFNNRLTNIFQGISAQPVFGGPVYILRNALYNVQVEPFKLHNSPSGVLVLHNTAVRRGMPGLLWTSDPVRNCVYRNNIFVGSDDKYTAEYIPQMVDCDFDYDGYAQVQCTNFLKWNGVRYPTFEAVRERAPVERHAVLLDALTLFASGLQVPPDTATRYDPATVDLRLREGSAAIEAGERLPGVNDDFAGAAPDLGAYELGAALPHYGPRP